MFKKLKDYILQKFIYNPLVYFYYTAKPKKINPIYFLRLKNEANSKRFIENTTKLNQYLLEVTKKSSSTGVNYSDHQLLYETVRKTKPKFVLELGSGVSSSTIAYALKKNKEQFKIDGKLISMEEDIHYHNQVKDITSPDLLPYIEFVLSKRMTRYIDNSKACYYDYIPQNNYDIIFIDGPTLRGIPAHEDKAFNADILDILSSIKYCPSHIFLDQRIGSLWSLKKFLPETKFKYYATRYVTRIYYKKNQKIIN